ncbi:MAG: MmgE/PrpD family protein [Candidatus Binatia bacterium]
MNGNNLTRTLADWIAGAKPDSLPRRVTEEAKNQVLGMIAAVHAGHFSDAGRVVTRTVKDWATGKDATLIPSGERTGLHEAIVGNAALALALDYDDYLFGAHTGATAVLATLAVAEKLGAGGPEFLLAQVLANEVGGRIGLASALVVEDPPLASAVHLAGGVALGASLLRLDGAQTEHALGIALSHASALPTAAYYGSEAKVVSAAMLAPLGVQAAEFAANGLRGAHDVLGGERGVLRSLGERALPGAFSGLGSVWLTESLGYTVYPGAPYVGAAVDCVLGLVRQHHIDARKVHAVHVGAGPHTLAMDARSAPYVRGAESLPSTLTQSVAWTVAAALVERELSPRQFGRDRIAGNAIWEAAGKVRLTLDDELARRARERSPLRIAGDDGATAHLFDLVAVDVNAFKLALGARVRIELEGGRSFAAEQEAPAGSGARPFDDRRKAVEDKFRRETRYTLRKERMEKAIDIVHHLEDATPAHVRELTRLCCSEKS